MSSPPFAPALGLFELESLARGLFVADAILKRAAVDIVVGEPVTPGKYLLIFVGREAEVAESFQAGLEAGGDRVLDSLHLPHMAEAVMAALLRNEVGTPAADEALGVIEFHTVGATLKAADLAVKHAQVRLTHLQLAKGIGGKGWFTVAGTQHDVEAALDSALASSPASLVAGTELIARPHGDLRRSIG